MIKVGVLGSTNGTDLQAIIDAIERRELDAQISLVVSNVEDAGILERARRHHIPTRVIESKARGREEFDREAIAAFKAVGARYILLIGFMRILSPLFIKHYRGRIFNVHPSLLPKFAGGMDRDVHNEVLASGDEVTGMTIHVVDEEVDHGAILIQKEVSIEEAETPDALKQKVQAKEQEGFLELLIAISEGRYDPDRQVIT